MNKQSPWERYFAIIPRKTVSGSLWLHFGYRRQYTTPGWYGYLAWEYRKADHLECKPSFQVEWEGIPFQDARPVNPYWVCSCGNKVKK